MTTPNQTLEPYREAAKKFGPDFGATLWTHRSTQRLRFDVFLELVELRGKRVLDVGSGPGGLCEYLMEKDVPYAAYAGIDGVAEVVSHATTKALPRAEFVAIELLHEQGEAAVLPSADVVTISGTLNTMTPAQATAVLERAWQAAGETLVFNFLSDRVTGEPGVDAPARRQSTLPMLDWALSQTPWVALRHDYFDRGHDATVAMYRRRQGPPMA